MIAATKWERGFPVATKSKMSKLSQAEASFSRPEWATFERVEFAGACLITPALKNLREAYGVTETAVQRMAKLPAPPPLLATVQLEAGYRRLAVDEPSLATLLALPALRSLTVHFDALEDTTPADVKRFCDATGDRLESLVFTGGGAGTGVPGGVGRGTLVAPILVEKSGSRLRVLGWGWTRRYYATARRDEGGRWSTIELHCEPMPLPANSYGIRLAETLVEGLGEGRFDLGRLFVDDPSHAGVAACVRILGTVARRVEHVLVDAPRRRRPEFDGEDPPSRPPPRG